MFSKAYLALSVALVTVPAAAGDLKITVLGVRSDTGALMIGLYDSNEGFEAAIKRSTEAGLLNDSTRVAGLALRAVSGARNVVIGGLAAGRYAVITFHDENDDGKLDATPWGVPTEGYGFSNDAQGFLQAPSFDAAAFEVTDTDTATTISLIYPRPSSARNLSSDKPEK